MLWVHWVRARFSHSVQDSVQVSSAQCVRRSTRAVHVQCVRREASVCCTRDSEIGDPNSGNSCPLDVMRVMRAGQGTAARLYCRHELCVAGQWGSFFAERTNVHYATASESAQLCQRAQSYCKPTQRQGHCSSAARVPLMCVARVLDLHLKSRISQSKRLWNSSHCSTMSARMTIGLGCTLKRGRTVDSAEAAEVVFTQRQTETGSRKSLRTLRYSGYNYRPDRECNINIYVTQVHLRKCRVVECNYGVYA